MSEVRSRRTQEEARLLLGLPSAITLPDELALTEETRELVLTTLKLDAELVHLSAQGLQLSPIREPRDGLVQARLIVAPPALRSRFFAGEDAREALESADLLRLVAELVPWMVDDPIGGALALEDTHRLWFDADGPTRSLGAPYRGHEKVLSLLLADAVRKAAAGFSTLEWLSSLGLPIEEWREPDDPSEEQIRADAKELFDAMRAEERAWMKAAFGR